MGLWQGLGWTWDPHYLFSGQESGSGGVGGAGPRAELFGKPGDLGGLQAGHSCLGRWSLSTCPWCPACVGWAEKGSWRKGWGPGGGWNGPRFVICDALIFRGPVGQGQEQAYGQESWAGTRAEPEAGFPCLGPPWEPGSKLRKGLFVFLKGN